MTDNEQDYCESDGDIFWREYCKMESSRFKKLKKVEEIGPFSWEFIRDVILFQRVSSDVDNEFEPVALAPKLLYWLGRSWRRENFEDEANEKPFRLFFIDSIDSSAIFVLTFAILCIVIIILIINSVSGEMLSHSPTFVSWSNSYYGEWLVVLLACLSFFVVKRIPFGLRRLAALDLYEFWNGIGFFILCVRLFELVKPIAVLFETDINKHKYHCFGLDGFEEVSQMRFFVLMIALADFCLSSVLSTLPFAWPWVFYYCSLMIVYTSVRLKTCESFLDVPASQLYTLRIAVLFCVLLSYIAVIAIFSYSFDRSMKSTYINSRHQTQLAHESRKMVDLLCSDVKVVVRSALKCYEEVFSLTKSALNLYKQKDNVRLVGDVLQHAIDMMLFLVKVGEGRHRVSFNDRVRLEGLVTNEVYRYGQAVALYTQGQESLRVKINAPNCLICVDKSTVEALIYCGLSAAHNFFRCENHRGKSSSSPLELSISTELSLAEDSKISLFKDRINQGYHLGELKFTIAKGACNTLQADSEIHLDPVLHDLNVIISSLVGHFNGSYHLHADRLQYTVFVALDLSRPENRVLFPDLFFREMSQSLASFLQSEGQGNTGNNTAESVSNTYRGLMADDEMLGALTRFLIQDCCIFATSPTLEPLLIDLICNIIDCESSVPITLWRELNITDSKIRKVIFVQSESAARTLREVGYDRTVVLCSEKLAYLDFEYSSTPVFDFVISLPATLEEIGRLRTFLHHVMYVDDVFGSVDGDRRKSFIEIPTKLEPQKDYQWLYLTYCLFMKWLMTFHWFTILPLPDNLVETYAKWRFLNPGNDLYHHTANVEYFSILSVISYIVYMSTGFISIHVFVINMVLTILLLYRRSFHRVLGGRLTMRQLWTFCAVLNILGIFSAVVGEVTRIVTASDLILTLSQAPTESLASLFSKYAMGTFETGKHALMLFVTYPMQLRYSSEFFPWPMSLVTVTFYCTRLLLLVHMYFMPLMYGWQYLVMLLILSLFLALTLFLHRVTEIRWRDEFLQLHRLISSRRYFDACLSITRRVRDALHVLTSSQDAIIKSLKEKILQENIIVGNTLQQQLHVMHRQHACLEQISMQLNTVDDHFASGNDGLNLVSVNNKDSLVAQLCAVLVRPIVTAVLGHFSERGMSSASNMVFYRIEPEVMIVRTDPELLKGVLTKLLRVALRHIEDARAEAQTNPKHCIAKHQILIWLRSVPLLPNQSTPPRFTDVRRMDIVCMHSVAGIYPALEEKVYHHRLSSMWSSLPEKVSFHKVPQSYSQYSTTSHPVNKYLPLFPHSSQISSASLRTGEYYPLFEEGIVAQHGIYKSYQRYTLPYLLTPRSQRFLHITQSRPALFHQPAYSVSGLSNRFSSLCRAVYLRHIAWLGTNPVIVGDTISEVETTSGKEGQQPLASSLTKNTTNVSTGFTEAFMASERAVTVQLTPFLRPRFTGRCSLYCQPYGFLSSVERMSIMALMRMTQWAVINYHPNPFPPPQSYQHSECIFIEYQIPAADTSPRMEYENEDTQFNSSINPQQVVTSIDTLKKLLEERRQAWQTAQARNHAYDVMELMHFVRMEGFLGIMIVLLPATMTDAEEAAARREVAHHNVYREAVGADLCIKLPFDMEKIQLIANTCERRFVELSLTYC